MDFSFLEKYRDLATNTYHVDPVIFVVIYVVSIPICYGCLFFMGKIIWNLKEKHKLKGHEILKHKNFLKAILIYQIAWIAPYFYVMVWGRDLPLWFWFFLVATIGIASYFFYIRIKKQTV